MSAVARNGAAGHNEISSVYKHAAARRCDIVSDETACHVEHRTCTVQTHRAARHPRIVISAAVVSQLRTCVYGEVTCTGYIHKHAVA
jgi:hypothetical protein